MLRFGTGAEALAWGVMFVLLPLSGVFYPTDALPTVMQPIALALPTTHAFAALRSLVDGNGHDWVQVGLAAIGSVVMLGLAMLVPRAHAHAVPQARLHHALHVIAGRAPARVHWSGSGSARPASVFASLPVDRCERRRLADVALLSPSGSLRSR